MKFMRGILTILIVVGLTACSNYNADNEVEALNEAKAVGSPFTQYLASEYRQFANHEMNVMYDHPDAIHFARKGLAAAAGEVVMPEPVSDWNLLPRHITELGTARGRLIVAFDLGAREIVARQAALAQSRFDCWIEQQEENWQTDDILACKSQYLDAVAALENMVKPQEKIKTDYPEPVVQQPAEPSEPLKPEDAMYLVFFDFDSSEIGPGGENVLDAVGEEVMGRNLELVSVIGHTDSSGPESYNNKLAMRRANAIRDTLAQRGVDPALIKVQSRGEDELLVPTDDGVREPANRRAEITFE